MQALRRNPDDIVKVQVRKMPGMTRQKDMLLVTNKQEPRGTISTSINLFPSVHIHLTTLSLFRDNYPWQRTTVVPLRSLSFFIKRLNENSKPKDTTV